MPVTLRAVVSAPRSIDAYARAPRPWRAAVGLVGP
jgi:hypothetical protein